MVETMSSLWRRVEESLTERDANGLRRKLTARGVESPLVDLSNNDYLRLSQHPEVIAAGQAALAKWGASAAASPLISGYTEAHAELELRLCQWANFPSGLIWNSGYAANQAVLGRLPQRGDIVLADRLIHASMIEGVLHSGARLRRYQHLDLGHLESLLQQYAGGERDVYVLTESVFSMDGDYPDLAAMAELKARYGFIWIVDEAHAIGWYGAKGSGLIEESGVTESVDVYVGTLGKGLGSMGAFTLFRKAELREYLVNFANEFIYSTYLAPACAAAASKAVDIAEAMQGERIHWRQRSRELRNALPGAPEGDSPIVPVMLGSANTTMAAAQGLASCGFRVGAVRPPTVPADSSRLRISLNTSLTESDLTKLVDAIKEAAQ